MITIFPRLWYLGKPDEYFPKFDWMQKIDDFFNTSFKNWIKNVIYYSPYSEELEEEADRIALQLITRCCYDVRKSKTFCHKYQHLSQSSHNLIDENTININNDNYFAKHPINNNKFRYFDKYMNAFLKLRLECNCDPLV
jgi:hypothetical protein